jgi:multiple sugar transport system permease protein
LVAYAFLAPALIVFALFAWWPIVNSFLLSFQKVKLQDLTGGEWVGLRNFERMVADPVFEVSWRNSVEFTVLSVLIGFFVPVIIAILVQEMRVAKAYFRLVYFLPTVIPPLIANLVWKRIYEPEGGLLNSFLWSLGIGSRADPTAWLQEPALVKPSMLIIMTWAGFGGTMLIYLAALQDVPVVLYEAAEIDGASILHRIRYITIPHMLPQMLVMLILQIIGVMQLFLEPFVLTAGGPANRTVTPVLTMYRKAFLNGDIGLASAWSVMMVIVLAIFSAVYLRVSRSAD